MGAVPKSGESTTKQYAWTYECGEKYNRDKNAVLNIKCEETSFLGLDAVRPVAKTG